MTKPRKNRSKKSKNKKLTKSAAFKRFGGSDGGVPAVKKTKQKQKKF